jgi:hypothetical protein
MKADVVNVRVPSASSQRLIDTIDFHIAQTGVCRMADKTWLALLYGNASNLKEKRRRVDLFARQHGWSVKAQHGGRLAIFSLIEGRLQ